MSHNDQNHRQSCDLLACQVSIPSILSKTDRQNHVLSMINKIDKSLARRHADIVVLPELSTIDYSREAFSQLDQLAETLEGDSVNAFRQLAVRHRTAIVFGMPRQKEEIYYISQIGIGSDGELLGCYDKMHICQYGASMEKEYFQRGKAVEVFAIAGFRFAPIICYDIRIPELSRSLTIAHEVDCILHCGAYYRDESFSSWHAFAVTRAMENQLYFLSLNRAGQQYGNSIFCPPWVDDDHCATQFDQHDEDFRYLTIEKSVIKAVRQEYTFLGDRLDYYE